MSEDEPRRGRAARPRDAATLVLVRRIQGRPHVLMGQRHKKHKFLPDLFVFPGGRVDRGDGYVTPATPLHPEVESKLVRSASPHRARAIALAAVRETFEETGLIVGERSAAVPQRLSPGWRPFFETGYAPALHGLDYICRAITPPFRPIRFNARFFLADGEDVAGDIRGSGELIDLDWIPVPRALKLETAGITERVLENLDAMLALPPAERRRRRVPFYRMSYGRRLVDDE